MADANGNAESKRSYRALLGLGGALSLCCLVTAPVSTGAAAAVTGGSAAATLGGNLVQILVTAVTVGLLAGFVRLRSGGE